ncbi:MAG: hypothetical protein IJT60_04775 [Clostridia bacterium]|nr:hypothetical protein [Clostridia bacterium]
MMDRKITIEVPDYVKTVIDRLEKSGYEAYLVGGCVRDTLLHRELHDYDLATDATCVQMEQAFEGMKTVMTGVRHGTLTVLSSGHPIEVTTYRAPGVDGHVTLEDDLSHRDFTINAMAYHPVKGLIDLNGGVEDLEKRTVRFTGSARDRVEEDPLRLLRALRFMSSLDFSMDPDADAIVRSKAGYLSVVAAERIYAEFKKLLLGPGARGAISAYPEVWKVLFPQSSIALESEKVGLAVSYSDPDVYVRLALCFMESDKALPYTEHSSSHFMHGLKADNLAQNTVRKILSFPRERLSGEQKTMHRLIAEHALDVTRESVRFDYALTCALSGQDDEAQTKIRARRREIEETIQRILDEGLCISQKDLSVSGSDLIREKVVPNGPMVGETMRRLFFDVVDGAVPNEKEALLDYARHLNQQTIRTKVIVR